MSTKTILKRIERAEEAAKAKQLFSADCICFPENEPPFFSFPIEQEIAARVKCPLHGERFTPRPHFYVSQWRIESEPARRQRLSAQYRKAWEASFPT